MVLGKQLSGLARRTTEEGVEALVCHAQPRAIIKIIEIKAEGPILLEVHEVF